MENEKIYIAAFVEAFSIEEDAVNSKLEYESIEEWDSIGHMGLIAELEDAFDISLEMDDIIDFSSFEKGKDILEKYEVKI